ncbi:MAG: glycosyltransferase [Candidatus Kaiserbacteria bacterium]|nr:glycosyltransferase [Candidatus Kaiserbacteria bacterium]
MKVLQIGSDRSIFDSDGASALRMRAYGKRFGELEMIIFSLRVHQMREARLSEHACAQATDSYFRFLYVWDAVLLALKLPKPDVVSVQDPFEAGITGWIVARCRRIPLHVQVHTDFLSPEYVQHSFLNWIRVLIAGFVLRRASRIRVVSERIKTSLEKKYNLRVPVAVLPIFVDVELFRNAKAEENLAKRFTEFKNKLLVVSRLEPEKNTALAVRAFAKSAPKDSCLIIVGEGRERARLVRLAQERGVSNRVFFEGAQAPIKYYKLANLVLAPSLYEGYGMVIVEALASGIPVLSTDVGIAREAGAAIASREKFPEALGEWFKNRPSTGESADFVARPAATTGGPPEGVLSNYPYKNFEEYVEAYCDDIKNSV